MNACNQNCQQGRTCGCVENEEYASSTQRPGVDYMHSSPDQYLMQRGPLTAQEIAGMQNATPQTLWDKAYMKRPQITMEDDSNHPWDWLDDLGDLYKAFIAVFFCAVAGVIVGYLVGPK